MAPVITAVAEPRPDGERIVKAIIELNGAECDASAITVKDRTVTSCERDGDIITLCLSEDDEKATVIPRMKRPGPGGPGGPGGSGGPGGPPRGMAGKKRGPIEVTANIPGVGEITSTKKVEKVIDDFVQGQYKHFPYNLFTPQLKDGEKYPLVVFIPDASANGDDPLIALSQGIGGTIWAEPENQVKHPCYVLAINVPKGIFLTNDNSEAAPEFEEIKELIDQTIAENQIDTGRIYMTGQSQGGMSTFEMNIRYPDFLAASLCVSSQWDPVRVGKLVNNKWFLGLSSGGPKEYPGQTAIVEEFIKNGAEVKRIDLNYRDGHDAVNAKINAEKGDAGIVWAVFDKETIWDDDNSNHSVMEHHARGWAVVYQYEAVRDWIFAQKKN